MTAPFFRDRKHAGAELAQRLVVYAREKSTVVLGLPRGGVPVAFMVAQALALPLDILLVRKLGLPGRDEFAMGAVASGGVKMIDEETLRLFQVPELAVERVLVRELNELERRERTYRAERPPYTLKGQTAILVDDGLATGSTMLAAIAALRQQETARIIAAVPVGSRETCEKVAKAADQMVCLHTPESFYAVSPWYDDFAQTSDEEVMTLLDASAQWIS